MSTSDPTRPSADGTTDASTTPAPTSASPDAPSGSTSTSSGPTGTSSASTDTSSAPKDTSPVPTDTGRHAVVRPSPTPPPEPGTGETFTPATGSTGSTGPADAPGTASPASTPRPDAPTTAPAAAASAPPPAPDPAAPANGPATPATRRTDPADDGLFPAPNAPRSTSFGAHVLGAVVGLLLAPAGVGLLLVGQARILDAQVEGWDGSTEVLGIVLVTIGLLVLGLTALLGIWTAAVPITGGALLTLLGGVYLFAPSFARAQTLDVLSDTGWRLTVTQVTVAGTSGTLLVAGFMLLLVGIVAAVARRRGVHLGEFRERHRV